MTGQKLLRGFQLLERLRFQERQQLFDKEHVMSDNKVEDGYGIDALIEAFTIFRKYGNPSSPTCCAHDVMYVQIEPNDVSEEDKRRLDELGFFPSSDVPEAFMTFRFGSA